MLLIHFSAISGISFYSNEAWENCTWPVKFIVHHVAPYPNISCVFEDGTGGAPSVPLDTIAVVEPNVTENEDGTFDYEIAPNIPVSYSTCLSCTSFKIVSYHPMKYLQNSFNTFSMTLFHFFLIHEEVNRQE